MAIRALKTFKNYLQTNSRTASLPQCIFKAINIIYMIFINVNKYYLQLTQYFESDWCYTNFFCELYTSSDKKIDYFC